MTTKIVFVLVALVASAAAQTNQPWLNTQTKIELGAVGGAIAADCYSTADLGPRNGELNPIVKPFFRDRTALAGLCLGTFSGVVVGNRLLVNHRRWRMVINWTITAVEVGMAARNMRLRR